MRKESSNVIKKITYSTRPTPQERETETERERESTKPMGATYDLRDLLQEHLPLSLFRNNAFSLWRQKRRCYGFYLWFLFSYYTYRCTYSYKYRVIASKWSQISYECWQGMDLFSPPKRTCKQESVSISFNDNRQLVKTSVSFWVGLLYVMQDASSMASNKRPRVSRRSSVSLIIHLSVTDDFEI